MLRNRRDPVICKVARTDKPNVKNVPKEFNPHVKGQSGPQEIKVTETHQTDQHQHLLMLLNKKLFNLLNLNQF